MKVYKNTILPLCSGTSGNMSGEPWGSQLRVWLNLKHRRSGPLRGIDCGCVHYFLHCDEQIPDSAHGRLLVCPRVTQPFISALQTYSSFYCSLSVGSPPPTSPPFPGDFTSQSSFLMTLSAFSSSHVCLLLCVRL